MLPKRINNKPKLHRETIKQ